MPTLSLEPAPILETTDFGLLVFRDNVQRNYDLLNAIINNLDSSNIKDGSLVGTDLNPAAGILEAQLTGVLQTKIDGALQTLVAGRLQWASSVTTPNGSGDSTISFPVAFPSAPSCIIVINGERAQGAFFCGVFNSATTTQFTFRSESSGGPQLAISRFNWIAII